MGLKNRHRHRLIAATAVAAALTVGTAGPAFASSVRPWRVEVCSYGSYQTTAQFSDNGFLVVPPGQCRTMQYQAFNGDYQVQVAAYVNGTYIASATVDVTQGAGLATSGTAGSPYMYSF